MKEILIKNPAKGKTTCTLVRQYYDREARRTKTEYLGSFNQGIDPDELPNGIKLKMANVLSDYHLVEVKAWLRAHGTFGELPRLPAATEKRLRERTRAAVLSELAAGRRPELEATVEALDAASRYIATESDRLRRQGLCLSKGMLTSMQTDFATCKTDVDHLKIRTNQIRTAFVAFENTLKEYQLMKSVSRGGQPRSRRTNARRN
jgi:hypothetical protein